jgi:hypothetical protein
MKLKVLAGIALFAGRVRGMGRSRMPTRLLLIRQFQRKCPTSHVGHFSSSGPGRGLTIHSNRFAVRANPGVSIQCRFASSGLNALIAKKEISPSLFDFIPYPSRNGLGGLPLLRECQ